MCSRLFIVLIMLYTAPLQAAEQDCVFDQVQRMKYNQELQKKYPGSRYIDNRYVLTIPLGKDLVKLGIGGCEHYGVLIELHAQGKGQYSSEQALMNKVIELASTYSQKNIDIQKLKEVIVQKQWQKLSQGDSDYYMLKYDKYSVFEVYRHDDKNNTVVGLNYYQ